MSTNDGGLSATDLNRVTDRRDTVFTEPRHFLFVVDEGPETSDCIALLESIFDHVDGSFDSSL